MLLMKVLRARKAQAMIRRDSYSYIRWSFRSSRADKIRATLALGVVLGLGSVGTMAAWSDQATATSGMFSAASLDIKVDEVDAYSFVGLSMSGMVPGSSKQGTLPIKNAGSVPFGYTMRAIVEGDDTFGEHLKVSTYPGAACSGDPLADAVPLRSTQSPISMISESRTLAAGGEETLCFTVGLDASLWDEPNWSVAEQVEGQTIDVTFEFTATGT